MSYLLRWKSIPTMMISPNTNIPWFKQTHKRAARHKCRSYDKAKSTNAPSDWETNKKLRRSVDCSIRKCRSEHLQAIGDNLMTSNPKPFLRLTKSLRQSSTTVSAFNTIKGPTTSALDKADAPSNQLQSVFTKEDCSNLPTLNSSPIKSMLPIQILTGKL